MTKLDLTKADKPYYTAKMKPELAEFGEVPYISITGRQEPFGEEFQKSIEAVFPLAFAIKFMMKEKGKDYVVPKLEGFWWVGRGKSFMDTPQNEWSWKFMIRQPNFVKPAHLEKAKAAVAAKKEVELAKRAKYETLKLGKCVQVMHIGPYHEEAASIMKIQDYINANNLKEKGKHQEVYISDPRRTAPDKLKTILRWPVS